MSFIQNVLPWILGSISENASYVPLLANHRKCKLANLILAYFSALCVCVYIQTAVCIHSLLNWQGKASLFI